ncbi:MAG: 50S ribosomal protein L10 [Nitrospiraceae bacterium]|nr:50S ribosomal protein L10 [Nitrospiraceae bacterium]
MNRNEKQQALEELKESFGKVKGAVITHYKGMTVAELTDLRTALRADGVRFKVVKNTLARKAAEGTPMACAQKLFEGPVGVALGYEDAVAVAKGIIKYSSRNEKLEPLAAVVEGQLVDAAELKSIAALPPRLVLLSMMAGTFSAPMAKMAGTLAATVSGLGHAFNGLLRKKEKEQAA